MSEFSDVSSIEMRVASFGVPSGADRPVEQVNQSGGEQRLV